jgi:hypothetical protein
MSVTYRLVHANPSRVFDSLQDGWSFASWVVGASRIRVVSSDWPSPRSSLHHSIGIWPAVIDDQTMALEWAPPHHAAFRAHGGPLGVALVRFDVYNRPDGCLVRMREDVLTGPLTMVPAWVRNGMLRVRNRETLRRLAYIAEGRHADAEGAARSGNEREAPD